MISLKNGLSSTIALFGAGTAVGKRQHGGKLSGPATGARHPFGVRSKMRRGWLRNALALAALALPLSAAAQSPVVIDDFTTDHSAVVPADPPGVQTEFDSVSAGSGIIGGQRHAIARRTAGTGLFFNEVSAEIFNHSAGSSNRGRSFLIWDGRPDANGAANDLDPRDENDIEFNLGPVDLTAGCSQNARAISFIATPDNAIDVPITVNLYSSSANFSTQTVNIPSGQLGTIRVVSFPFSGFTTAGGTGADETSIAAIRLSIDGTGADQIDLSIQSAVSACGYDFGDAPEADGYSTTSDIKADTSGSPDGFIQNNTAEGPAHRITGPFLGAGTNERTPRVMGSQVLALREMMRPPTQMRRQCLSFQIWVRSPLIVMA